VSVMQDTSADCPRCKQPAGEMCVYVTNTNIHRDAETGEFVWNVIGEPTTRIHRERIYANRRLSACGNS